MLLVFAPDAVAIRRALQARTVTLTVLLLALRLFARAFFVRHVRLHSLEGSRFPEVSHLLGEKHLVLVSNAVLAGDTYTGRTAQFSPGEALAVEFQTADFGTLATVR